ncbi:MMPL family transporter [Streptomyces cyaneofuscatus]|uniref:MMPL family transporter n=1 Tax=Streptomyces cyaneofuscatus TaxID=66883 RepID=UPI00364F63B6
MPRPRALEVALDTSGRCVLCSAVVTSSCLVAVAAIPVPLLRALALAGVAVTLLAALAALTVLPAALTLLGDRVDGADPLRRLRRDPIGGPSRFWRELARRVTARPAAAGVGALAVLVVMAWPAMGLRLGAIDERTLAPTASQRRHRGRRARIAIVQGVDHRRVRVKPAGIPAGAQSPSFRPRAVCWPA